MIVLQHLLCCASQGARGLQIFSVTRAIIKSAGKVKKWGFWTASVAKR